MATNYTDLKGEIKAQIKPNGVGAITGQVLQDAMLNLVGATEAEMSALNAATDEKLAQLDQDLKDIAEISVHSQELIPNYSWDVGFVDINGKMYAYDGYRYSSPISVKEGDIVQFLRKDSSGNNTLRVITAYNGTEVISNEGKENYKDGIYTVPSNVTEIVLTIDAAQLNSYGNLTTILRQEKVIVPKGVADLTQKVQDLYKKGNVWESSALSLNAGEEIILANRLDIKKGCQYNVFFKFEGEFDANTTIIVGCGEKGYMSSRLVITKDNIYTYISGSQYKAFSHGLLLSQFLSINVEILSSASNAAATIRINTLGGEYVIGPSNDTYFPNCNGKVFFRPSITVSDVTFVYSVSDLSYDIIVFGDSYISLADSNRWPYYMMTRGCHNFALCGFGGAKSADVIQDFREIAKKRMPNIVVWAIGMNDGDEGSLINENWLECVKEVHEWCDSNDKTLILCTIPNVPNISHINKNDYVRNSGLRYIDFAKAVNAENINSSWYDGMLGSDGVHPTEVGAKALYYRILLDCPEIFSSSN